MIWFVENLDDYAKPECHVLIHKKLLRFKSFRNNQRTKENDMTVNRGDWTWDITMTSKWQEILGFRQSEVQKFNFSTFKSILVFSSHIEVHTASDSIQNAGKIKKYSKFYRETRTQ